MQSRVAYVSFDTVPAPKGAATHIEAFARALARGLGAVELVTVAAGNEASPRVERWPGVFHSELPAVGKSLIDRVLCFRRYLRHWFSGRNFEAIQFRSIFEGFGLTGRAKPPVPPRSRLIFEVNGLPSIELKYRYPRAADDRELTRKILAQEDACLRAADLVVTPSGVTQGFLASRGVDTAKIRVIPNGVDVSLFRPCPDRPPGDAMRLLYFGTLTSWQGVELGIRAVARMRARLTIVGTANHKQREALVGLAAKLGVGAEVQILPPVPQTELAEHVRASDAVLVPLTLNDRNLLQGCCSLKVLEGMAAGVPVIASDLPVVRELGCDGVHFLLVKPGSVDQIADAALRLWTDRSLAQQIARQGREHVEARYTWELAGDALLSAYCDLGIS